MKTVLIMVETNAPKDLILAELISNLQYDGYQVGETLCKRLA
jgi:hypothetical protein